MKFKIKEETFIVFYTIKKNENNENYLSVQFSKTKPSDPDLYLVIIIETKEYSIQDFESCLFNYLKNFEIDSNFHKLTKIQKNTINNFFDKNAI